LKFESSAIHTYYSLFIRTVRNAMDDSCFLGPVTSIELSNLGHCFRPRYPPGGGTPPPIEGGGLKRGKETEKEEKRQEKEEKRQEKEKKRQKKRKSKR